jgi:hypothetical protein
MTKTVEEYQAEIDLLNKERKTLERKISSRYNKIKKIREAQSEVAMSDINFDDIDSITTEQWKYILYHWHDIATNRYKKCTNFLYSLGLNTDGLAGQKHSDTVRQFSWSFHTHYDLNKYKEIYFRVKDALNFFKSSKDDTDVWQIYLFVNMFGQNWSNSGHYIEIRKEDDMCRIIDEWSSYKAPTKWMTWDEVIELVNKYVHVESDDDEYEC